MLFMPGEVAQEKESQALTPITTRPAGCKVGDPMRNSLGELFPVDVLNGTHVWLAHRVVEPRQTFRDSQ
jgi:hypothetical protein